MGKSVAELQRRCRNEAPSSPHADGGVLQSVVYYHYGMQKREPSPTETARGGMNKAKIVGSKMQYGHRLSGIEKEDEALGQVQGTDGEWLGVEWDDPARGKHSGELKGVKYFECRSNSPTAGSFLRPARLADRPRGFLEALRTKGSRPIEISGKVVEEVGFEKIRKQLAALRELKIVILDGMRLRGVLAVDADNDLRKRELEKIKDTCPMIRELDLNRNFLADWIEVMDICEQFMDLRSLKLNGNRLGTVPRDRLVKGVLELSLDETLMTWEEISILSYRFPDLRSLSLSSNQISLVSRPITDTIRELSLESNIFCSLGSLSHLASLPQLNRLSLRRNKISKIQDATEKNAPLVFSPTLTTLDISLNLIDSWAFIDALPTVFPGLTNLRISDNPLYEKPPASTAITGLPEERMTVDEAYMLTLARLSKLRVLNYGKVSPQDRVNGELYYLSLIKKELSAFPESAEKRILASHPRYDELCLIYGTPEIKRLEGDAAINPRSLAARLVNFTFYIPNPNTVASRGYIDDKPVAAQTTTEFKREIPRTFDIYRIKAIVARHFSLPPLSFKLIWETEEWDPVEEGTAEEDEWDSSDEIDGEPAEREWRKKFVRREEEFVDSTRAIEHWLSHDTRELRVRVERY
ncbi:tubulin-specific chaperone E [Coccidioides immitis H538.4]|uniref:Tubulin-specific chaperone E n=1 Tax=Coccidioides immitis H538.4 TaxID=396776 RepID=A0A0J8RU77_COCIT|nr:tubulin-specific chaperone E [Coccidioides immitis H538.4]